MCLIENCFAISCQLTRDSLLRRQSENSLWRVGMAHFNFTVAQINNDLGECTELTYDSESTQ
jgi:hypothetical protein